MKLPKLSVGQWKAIIVLASAGLGVLGAFFPDYAHHCEGVALFLSGKLLGILVNGPGTVSVTTHPDDLP